MDKKQMNFSTAEKIANSIIEKMGQQIMREIDDGIINSFLESHPTIHKLGEALGLTDEKIKEPLLNNISSDARLSVLSALTLEFAELILKNRQQDKAA